MSPPAPRTTLDPGEDARLVERCLAGDARAWDALVRRHERLVYAVARSYRLTDPDLSDVFQDVFAALVRGLPRLRDARALVRWLSSTTDRIARAVEFRRRRELALRAGDSESWESLPDTGPEVGADLDQLEAQAHVRLALAELPERCRRLLTALYYEDPPPAYTALARRLGMPVGSLGPTRARCMDRLRQALERREEDSPGISAATPSTFESDDGRVRSAAAAAAEGFPHGLRAEDA